MKDIWEKFDKYSMECEGEEKETQDTQEQQSVLGFPVGR